MPKLTKAYIDKLAPHADRNRLIWDDQVPGFGIRLNRGGSVAFVLQYRNAERRSKRLTLGPYGVLTPSQARQKACRLLIDVLDGKDPSDERRRARDGETVADLCEKFLADHARPRSKPSSVRVQTRLISNCILPRLGNRKIAFLTRQDVLRFHSSMSRTPYQANRCLSVLRKAFNLAEDWGLRPEFSNPCRGIKRFAEPGRERFLSETELARLGEALRRAEEAGSVPCECIPAFRLYILTGCRHDEIRLLKWANVDLDRGVLELPDSKTGPRTVHLNAPAIRVLSSIERRSEWVIPSPVDSNKPYGRLNRSWYVIRKIAGLADVRIHDLRHSFASIGAAQGQSLLMIGLLLGHKQITTTQKYAHLADGPVRAANERIGSLIDATMSGARGDVIQLRR